MTLNQYFYVILLLISTNSLTAQCGDCEKCKHACGSLRKEYNFVKYLYGNVKSVRLGVFRLDSEESYRQNNLANISIEDCPSSQQVQFLPGRRISKWIHQVQGDTTNIREYTYDNKGLLKERLTLKKDSVISLVEKSQWFYDDSGNIIKEIHIEKNESKKTVTRKFDLNGYDIEEIEYNENHDTLRFHRNEYKVGNGNCTVEFWSGYNGDKPTLRSRHVYNSSGKKVQHDFISHNPFTWYYKYDSVGNEVEFITMGGYAPMTRKTEYDSLNHKRIVTEYDTNGIVNYVEKYNYIEPGKIKEIFTFNKEGTLTNVYKRTNLDDLVDEVLRLDYVNNGFSKDICYYDKHNNLVRKEYYYNGKLESIEMRIIDYYESK